MKKVVAVLALALSLGSAADAAPAVFEDGVLDVGDGVVVGAGGDLIYKNIRLQADSSRNFRVVSAEPRNLATVESVEVLVMEGFPVQAVQVEGHISMSCLDLEEPIVLRREDGFAIYLPETPLDPLALCAAVIEPFSATVPLDVSGLQPGDYTVSVNGVEAAFTLLEEAQEWPEELELEDFLDLVCDLFGLCQ